MSPSNRAGRGAPLTLVVAGLTFGTAYRIVSWASWLVNLAAVEWWLRRRAVAGSEA